MGCEYVWQDRAVLKTFTGFLSGSAFIQTAEAVAAHPRFDGLQVIYNDFSGIDGHSIDASTYARSAACRLGAMVTNPNFRVVFIARSGDAQALLQVVQPSLRGAPFDPFVCNSLDEAHTWFDQQGLLDAPRGLRWHAAPNASGRPAR